MDNRVGVSGPVLPWSGVTIREIYYDPDDDGDPLGALMFGGCDCDGHDYDDDPPQQDTVEPGPAGLGADTMAGAGPGAADIPTAARIDQGVPMRRRWWQRPR